MNNLSFARINECLNATRDSFDRDYNERIVVLNQREDRLKHRLYELNHKKHETSQATGTLDTANDDLVEINVRGKIMVVKRSTLTQMRERQVWRHCSADVGIRSCCGTAMDASFLMSILIALVQLWTI